MKHTLHIIKNSEASEALELISSSEKGDDGVQVLLIQEAVGLTPSIDLPIYILKPDLIERKLASPHQLVDYDKMLEMVLTADSVRIW